MAASDFLTDSDVRRWLGDVEPAWTLLNFESLRALRQEPSRQNRAISLSSDLTDAEIAGSAMVRNALILLERANEADGLKLTATGNLSRNVVAEMIQRFRWPGSNSLTWRRSARSSMSLTSCRCTFFGS